MGLWREQHVDTVQWAATSRGSSSTRAARWFIFVGTKFTMKKERSPFGLTFLRRANIRAHCVPRFFRDLFFTLLRSSKGLGVVRWNLAHSAQEQ